jgi:hypothetical protein
MFDRKIDLTSTDSSITLSIVAGSEGLKSMAVTPLGGVAKAITPQQLIDLATPAIKEWLDAPSSAAPAPG